MHPAAWSTARVTWCGWTNDGHLVFEGRVDAQVKVRGFRIELGEVERALEAHPDVAEAVATVLASPAGEPTLVAFIVSHTAADPQRIRQALAATLPAHLVPARIGVVPALPRSSTGKLDRRALTWPSRRRAAVHTRGEPARERARGQRARALP
jgi:acyl-coenzyme A synthetase/AMP-(fatty) acid ligase